ncbi:hypothetical protein BJN45_15295 [Azonexus hydrophilus]|uniref:Uncharacterized protein n=1 Tax=Azonexus hydrophilus TaxID=418702 RepID=A0A1R1HZV9_9RHOO|nr:hypothetical protein BJN45_15295 [Azonexus hydrophilus]
MAGFYRVIVFGDSVLTSLFKFKSLIFMVFNLMPRFLAGQGESLFFAGLRGVTTGHPQTYPQVLGISAGEGLKSLCLPLRRGGGRIAD